MALFTEIERPLEPRESKYIPMMTEEEENRLLRDFCKEHADEFLEFVDGFDSLILWDFADSIRWKWDAFKEENRSYE